MDHDSPVRLHGVTGSATVPTNPGRYADRRRSVGGFTRPAHRAGCAGRRPGDTRSGGLLGKRIFIDFRHDRISITFSRNEKSPRGFVDVPFHAIRGTLVVVDAMVGDVRTKAIIDTGGQATIANLALRNALVRTRSMFGGKRDQIIGATKDIQEGELIAMPPIEFGTIHIYDSGVTFGDMYIFKQWNLLKQPAILIGMDALGLLDTLVIDYRRHELQMRMPRTGDG